MRSGAPSPVPVAHMVANSRHLHDETASPEAGCRPAGEVPGLVFLLVFLRDLHSSCVNCGLGRH